MRVEETAQGTEVWLTDHEYSELRRASETYREELVLRLGAEVGLRPAEMAQIRPEHVTTYRHENTDHFFLAVPCRGGSDEDGVVRTAYLPDDVEHDLRQFAGARNVADDEQVISVTPRRVQMIVSDVADRAADRTGKETFRRVSSRTLRQYFARRLLADAELHPRIVQSIGGWDRLESLDPFMDDPEPADVAAAFEQSSLWDRSGVTIDSSTFRIAVERAGHAVYVTDTDGVIEYVNPAFEAMTGYSADEALGRTPRILDAGEHEQSVFADLWETITDGDVWEGFLVNRNKDGETFRVHQTVAPIVTDGQVERFVAIASERAAESAVEGSTPALNRLDAVLDRVRATSEGLAVASTREEVVRVLCQRLTDGAPYACAWLGERSGETMRITGCAGASADQFSGVGTGGDAAAAALEDCELTATDDVATDQAFTAWRTHATEAGYDAAATIPVVDGDTVYGVLGLASTDVDGFGERERRLLAHLGEWAGQTITAVEQRKLLLADTAIELELRTTDQESFFVAASREYTGTFTLEGVVPAEEQSLLYFVTLEDAPAEAVLAWAADQPQVSEARLVRDYGDQSLLEFVLAGRDISKALAEQGATIRDLKAADGVQKIVGEVPADADVRTLVDDLTDVFPSTELLTKRERERPAESAPAFRSSLRETLTEKQVAVLQAAYHAGYFEWPRGSTAEELATSMGITSPTLHNHLRRAQQKLLTAFFTDEDQPPDGETPWAEQ